MDETFPKFHKIDQECSYCKIGKTRFIQAKQKPKYSRVFRYHHKISIKISMHLGYKWGSRFILSSLQAKRNGYTCFVGAR